jgi:GNAT superfamily N-acetyltransferase
MYQIRPATPKDREAWFRLCRDYVEEQFQQGSVIKPASGTWRQYLDFFDSYVGGSLWGLCLLAEVVDEVTGNRLVGFALGGESPSSLWFETTRGKSAILWAVYTVPEYRQQGISKALLIKSKEVGADLGFDCVVSEILPKPHLERNAWAAGTQPYTTVVWAPLKES